MSEVEKVGNSGISVGLKKGFPVDKKEKLVRPSHAKAVSYGQKNYTKQGIIMLIFNSAYLKELVW